MENSNNQSNQSRFLIAAVLSMVVLFGWSYFFTPKKPANDNSNTATNNNSQEAPVAQTTPAPAVQQPQTDVPGATTPDMTPNRTITIRSPLYEVKLDSKGALATSWVSNSTSSGFTSISPAAK